MKQALNKSSKEKAEWTTYLQTMDANGTPKRLLAWIIRSISVAKIKPFSCIQQWVPSFEHHFFLPVTQNTSTSSTDCNDLHISSAGQSMVLTPRAQVRSLYELFT